VEACEWNGANPTVFDQAHERVRHARSRGDVALAEVLPTTERADHPAESDRVHARTMDRRACLRMHSRLRRCTVSGAMCFDFDSRPPIAPIKGGSLESGELTLTGDDGNRFSAFAARAAKPTGAGIVILPDVRGLHAYYEDLALRFAEQGVDAVAIDYFGRTGGLGRRETGFEYMPHVNQTTFGGLSADIRAGAAYLRSEDGGRVTSLYTVGFCFGGRLSFLAATLGLDLAGVIGFYGIPVGPGRAEMPAPADVAERFASPVLGLFGGADPAIPPTAVVTFDAALTAAGVEHRLVSYPDAPHSFFDRKADEFGRTSEAAWAEVLEFIRTHTRQAARA
jgi:carboxymethylenebutenolidase